LVEESFFQPAQEAARKPEEGSSAAHVRTITINVCECQTHSGFSLFEIFISISLFFGFVNPFKWISSIIYCKIYAYVPIKKRAALATLSVFAIT